MGATRNTILETIDADAKNKLKALAGYAERFGDQFVRITSVAKAGDGSLRSLDLKERPCAISWERVPLVSVG